MKTLTSKFRFLDLKQHIQLRWRYLCKFVGGNRVETGRHVRESGTTRRMLTRLPPYLSRRFNTHDIIDRMGVIAEDVSVGRMPTLQKSFTFNLYVVSFRLSNICCSHRCACINCFDMHIFDLLCCEHTYDSITFFSGICSAQFHISWISGDTSMAVVWRLWQMGCHCLVRPSWPSTQL